MKRTLATPLLVAFLALAASAQAQPKVILDTDFETFNDDGQAFVLLAQLHAANEIDLLGMTIVTGNAWLDQSVAEALRAVERMGLEDEVSVHAGAALPLVHDPARYAEERERFGLTYGGAFDRPRPGPDDLVPPPDGFAQRARLSDVSAVDFIVEQVRANPGEVDLLLLGPATNLALALRAAPDLADALGRVIVMGGAFGVPGNVTRAAEFNWWFDPEAAREVLRSALDPTIVPLDVTNTVELTGEVYERIVRDAPPTAVTELFRDRYDDLYAADPEFETDVWDTLTIAVLRDPGIVTRSRTAPVDVVDAFGEDYGRSRAYRWFPPEGSQRATIVRRIDEDAFWDFYVDLMTRPVPMAAPE